MWVENKIDIKRFLDCYKGTPRGRNSSVRFKDENVRFDRAEKQSKKPIVALDMIIKHVNDFLEELGMERVDSPKYMVLREKINYVEICAGLEDKRDIVWLKFTTDKYLGVVATSNDINFNIPKLKEEYSVKRKSRYMYNTSGIIIHHLNKEWDDSFVLVFPLKGMPPNYCRGDIERGIGNYLIEQGVPILDFYSHNY